jgi:hypothetical protein
MKKQLDTELKKAHARCVFLEVLQVELPTNYEDSIVLTQVEVQNSRMKKFEQEAAYIRQEIDLLISETQQVIRYTEATAQADSYLLRQTATVIDYEGIWGYLFSNRQRQHRIRSLLKLNSMLHWQA